MNFIRVTASRNDLGFQIKSFLCACRLFDVLKEPHRCLQDEKRSRMRTSPGFLDAPGSSELYDEADRSVPAEMCIVTVLFH